jgi:UTP--glucose-1-phosphate uridylyltransferase
VFGVEGACQALVDCYEKNPEAEAIIAVQTVEGKEIEKYGAVKFKAGSSQELETMVEKPKQVDAPSQLASYGRYLLRPSIFQYLTPDNIGKDAELWTADAIGHLARDGKKVLVTEAKGQWMTTGDPANYFLAHLTYVLAHENYAGEVCKLAQSQCTAQK